MSKIFGNYHKVVIDPKENGREALKHAIVDGGRLVATNAQVMMFGKLNAWMGGFPSDTQEIQLSYAEGKLFNYELLSKMAASKWKCLRFAEKGVEFYLDAYGAKVVEFSYYSGALFNAENRQYKIWDVTGKEEQDANGNFNIISYPDWKSVIPFADKILNNEFDFDGRGTDNVCLNAKNLALINDCFYLNSGILRFNYPSSSTNGNPPVIVRPLNSDHEEVALIMAYEPEIISTWTVADVSNEIEECIGKNLYKEALEKLSINAKLFSPQKIGNFLTQIASEL